MNTVIDIPSFLDLRKTLQGKNIGFVPTMGNLHEGHLNLCRRAKSENEIVVASIFVNATQFNDAQDFDLYPRTLEQDKMLLESVGVDILFLPNHETLYPDNYEVQVTETSISTLLEGACRPGHFTGMLTVILKLLNIVAPTRAYFGKKDYQQYLLIDKMVRALFLPIDIIPCETVRSEDGLALSSRNTRLSSEQREKAVLFAKILKDGKNPEKISEALRAFGITVDYVSDTWGRRLAAVSIDGIRLIDNGALSYD